MSNFNVEDKELRNIVTRIVRDTVSGENVQGAKGSAGAPAQDPAAEAKDGPIKGFLGANPDVVPVEMSNRHVHLTEEDVEVLFGKGASLTYVRDLTLPGFVSEERVNIVTPKGSLNKVVVLGPPRPHTQVEVSAADAYVLGVDPPINLSGDYTGALDCYLVGPAGILHAKNSLIIAKAHVHLNPEEAKERGYVDKQYVDVEVLGKRSIILKDVQIRVAEGMYAMLHVDLDEANAAMFQTEKRAIIHKK